MDFNFWYGAASLALGIVNFSMLKTGNTPIADLLYNAGVQIGVLKAL